jgi:hypothetical protein
LKRNKDIILKRKWAGCQASDLQPLRVEPVDRLQTLWRARRAALKDVDSLHA